MEPEKKPMLKREGDEAPKDPGCSLTTHPSYTDQDFQGHRAHDIYVGFHVPTGYRRRHRHHHRKHGGHSGRKNGNDPSGINDPRPVTPPSERVHFILEEDDQDGAHESHPLFSELEELIQTSDDEYEWRERARWIKFEEDVEEGGDRWSKPHVATISLHSLFELRSCILNGTVMLDVDATSLDQIADLVLENIVSTGNMTLEMKEKVKEALLRRHRHQHEKKHDREKSGARLPLIRSLADIGRNPSKTMFSSHNNGQSETALHDSPSSQSLQKLQHGAGPVAGSGHGHATGPGDKSAHATDSKAAASSMLQAPTSGASLTHSDPSRDASSMDLHKANKDFMRKIPPGAEADNILVGVVDFLDKAISGFVRLSTACHLGDLTEVPVPTRFIFILLGPPSIPGRYHEIGRAMATLMSDEIFHDVAYKARNRQDLLAGVDEFLDAVTILPPGAWDPSIRIEPPSQVPSQEGRKTKPSDAAAAEAAKRRTSEDEEYEEEREREANGLKRTGIWFGGLKNDLRRKAPWWISDFKDAIALQSIASIFFLYFACLTPIITFGGLLGEATDQNIATMESLLSGAICGIIYGLFSGQPLTILGSTGPVLVFETILHDFCKSHGLYYLSLRLWIGLWTSLILMIFVAVDASAFVCYITRFTEENFATLISVIFIYKAIEKVLEINKDMPMNVNPQVDVDYTCYCDTGTGRTLLQSAKEFNRSALSWCTKEVEGGVLVGDGCATPPYVPNVFLLSVILFAATYVISVTLKDMKTSTFFPTKVRSFLSDFAVVIAIFSMTAIDNWIGLETPKLLVPHDFKPTRADRGWLIPAFNGNPWWTVIVSPLPALLATILIFMDQQITAVIINRKENKLKKGCGYHLDLFVLSLLIAICSILGLPWFVAATVLSMTHVNSLRMESECAAPGDKPQFLGVREQRLTHIFIFVGVGLSVFLTRVLSHIPMPILFGVFLYMGTSSLKGSQMYTRCLIMFMPEKYQPDYLFLRSVTTRRVHLFTFIQLTCFVVLWVIKSYKPTSITFPLMLVVMLCVRKCLDFLFTQKELKILDDVMPEHTKRRKAEEQAEAEAEAVMAAKVDERGRALSLVHNASGNLSIPLASGNILKIPVDKFATSGEESAVVAEPNPAMNISEQLAKSGAWKSIDQQQKTTPPKKPNGNGSCSSKGGARRISKEDLLTATEEERKRLSTMTEEDDEEDCGIQIVIDPPKSPLSSNGRLAGKAKSTTVTTKINDKSSVETHV